jgi:hypothetical protein
MVLNAMPSLPISSGDATDALFSSIACRDDVDGSVQAFEPPGHCRGRGDSQPENHAQQHAPKARGAECVPVCRFGCKKLVVNVAGRDNGRANAGMVGLDPVWGNGTTVCAIRCGCRGFCPVNVLT